MEMKFLDLRFKLTSPAIITLKKTATGFLSTLDYIPASTLRGALVSSLYRNELVREDFLRKEGEDPHVVSSPAYLISNGEKAYPCHPFAYECKAPHEDLKERFYNYAHEVLPKLEEGNPPEYKTSCSKGHMTLRPLQPESVIPDKHFLVKVSLHSYRTMSVGINKLRATSEKGMLFEYDVISADQSFWSHLAVPDDLNLENGMEFMVGRGVSRGFGRAKITSVTEIQLEKLEELVTNAMNGNIIILYSLSNTLSTSGDEYMPYPESIRLEAVAGRCGFKAEGRLNLKSAYGKTSLLIAGWDMIKNKERPIFNHSGSRGSVFVANVEKGINAMKAVAALGFMGTVESVFGMQIIGVNMLTPLRNHPMVGGEK